MELIKWNFVVYFRTCLVYFCYNSEYSSQIREQGQLLDELAEAGEQYVQRLGKKIGNILGKYDSFIIF